MRLTAARLDIIERLHDAVAGGDGLNNAEYMLVQDELTLVDGRIQELDYILQCRIDSAW